MVNRISCRGYGIRTHDFKDGFLAMYRTFFILTMIKARKNFFHRKKVKLYKTLRPGPTRRTHDFCSDLVRCQPAFANLT